MKKRRLPDFISVMTSSNDEKTIIEYENTLSYMFAIPILLTGATMNLVMMFFVFNKGLLETAFNSIFLLSIAIIFKVVLERVKDEYQKANIFTFLFSCIFIFVVVRFYNLIGPAVWSLSVVIIIISLMHIKNTMLVVMAITIISMAIYVMINNFQYEMNYVYYITQIISFIVMFTIGGAVNKIIGNRFKRILSQYQHIFMSEEKLSRTLSSVGDGVITVDSQGTVEFMNSIAESLTGWEKEKACGLLFDTIYKVVDEDTEESIDSPIKNVFQDNAIIDITRTKILVNKNGDKRVIDDTVSPIKNRNGDVTGAIIVFRDFTRISEEKKQIEYLSYHDQLTGLYNRRFYEEELERLDTSRNLPLSFIFGDVNGLKTINDAFGHRQGDRLIKEVANALKSECREDDIISRIGGDEFVILLPNTKKEFLKPMIERIQLLIDKKKIMNIDISVSFGGDTKLTKNESTLVVLKRAEDKMYQKKIFENLSKRSGVIKSIINTLHIKSPRENAHSKRVSLLCEAIGKAFEMNDDDVRELRIAGELHDIGKIAIDDVILNKPGKLSQSEWKQIQKHPVTGYRLLSTSAEYYNIASYVKSHHEQWDGSGYPNGLKGEEIPFKTRIISLADAYDAMTCQRPYRKALSREEAIEEIEKNAGLQFDPNIVRVFVEKVDDISEQSDVCL
jgi:diguanylate cyclase (GGDEF)-like protein/PAS domain S-box-containing protein